MGGLGKTFLVTGGSGSGKSGFAERLVARLGDPVLYLATGKASGPEMAARIRQHRARRPQHWPTVEAPRGLAGALSKAPAALVVLLEDLPSLVTACLPQVAELNGQLAAPALAESAVRESVDAEVDAVVSWCAATDRSLVIVTSEVGSGVLPHGAVDRLFKDVLGRLNARLAKQADRVFAVISGMAVDLTHLNHETLHWLAADTGPAPSPA